MSWTLDLFGGVVKKLVGGTVGSVGLLSLIGTCGGVCSASALPLGALLASLGFGGLSIWLLDLRWPLLALSAIVGCFAIVKLVRRRNTIGSALFGLFLGAALAINVQIAFSTPRTPSVPLSHLSSSALDAVPDQKIHAASLEDLRVAFNADSQKVRIVTLLSPECGGCVKGHGIFKHVFETNKSEHLSGLVVWLPMVKGDSFASAKDRAWSVNDERITDFWDKDRNIGVAFTGTLGLNRTAWDVYVVYPPGVIWEENRAPPKPSFWMHQLWGVPRDNFLDAAQLSQKVGELTQQVVM